MKYLPSALGWWKKQNITQSGWAWRLLAGPATSIWDSQVIIMQAEMAVFSYGTDFIFSSWVYCFKYWFGLCGIFRVASFPGCGKWIKTWKKWENELGICLESIPGEGMAGHRALRGSKGPRVAGGGWAGVHMSERQQRPDRVGLRKQNQIGAFQESVAHKWTSW